MRCTFLLIVLARTTSTDYTATSFLFHTPEISIAPQGSDDCVEQPLPPEGDGCGEEVLSWMEHPTPPAKKAQEPAPISEACVTVLKQKREK
ncbi:penicillin-insensitive murein endopeptidase [Vibrio vulnificus]|uniref:penicillin-insensitive murein endopeptidase n=1 Tax=Vibrio vulnificus TaxID=672 RepID=UPI001EEEFD33|nr:penicillin-insensitive murein endopeptidase [Vibrio vulnificus]